MDIFSQIKELASDELIQLVESLPLQLTAMDVAHFLGVSRTTAYKLVHSEGFPAVQFPGFKRLIVPKKLFLDWFVTNMKKSGFDVQVTKETQNGNPARTLAEEGRQCYDRDV